MARKARTRQTLGETFRLIHADIVFRCQYEHKKMTWPRVLNMLLNAGVSSTIRYRLQCFLCSHHLGLLGKVLKRINLVMYAIDIDEDAQIGGGLFIVHASHIVISSGVTIGERCILFHQNSITTSPFREPGSEREPIVIGNDATFGGGAGAYGPITIGDRCTINTNSTVEQSCPADSTLFGVPARAKPGKYAAA